MEMETESRPSNGRLGTWDGGAMDDSKWEP